MKVTIKLNKPLEDEDLAQIESIIAPKREGLTSYFPDDSDRKEIIFEDLQFPQKVYSELTSRGYAIIHSSIVQIGAPA